MSVRPKYHKHNLELVTIREMIKVYNEGSMTQQQLCDYYKIPLSTFKYYKNYSKNQRGGINPEVFITMSSDKYVKPKRVPNTEPQENNPIYTEQSKSKRLTAADLEKYRF